MWDKIKIFLIGFISAIGSVIIFFITRGKGNTTNIGQSDIDRNNNNLRQGSISIGNIIEREAERIRREREQLKRDKSVIKDTRRTVSDIIRKAKKST